MKKHIVLFNIIAPVYGLFFGLQKRRFSSFVKRLDEKCECHTILDVGFGTGALLRTLHESGKDVHGIDGADKMLKIAQKKNPEIADNLKRADISRGLPFKDDSFDCVISSYLLHGLKPAERKIYYEESKRVSKGTVVLYEHTDNPNILVKIAEIFEGGEYFRFRKVKNQEFKEHFSDVKTMKLSKNVMVYILYA